MADPTNHMAPCTHGATLRHVQHAPAVCSPLDDAIRVLMIEDDDSFHELLRRLLQPFRSPRFVVQRANTLMGGLELLRDGTFDVVVLDLMLPDSKGLATLAALRAQAPSAPIVVLSGMDNDKTAIEAVKAGAQDYMVKCDTSGQLLARSLRHAVERKQTEEALRASERRFRYLVQAVSQIVWATDAEGAPHPDQQAWTEFTGQDGNAAMGLGWLDAVHPEDRDMVLHAWVDALRHRSVYETQHRLRRADGTYRYMSARAVPVFDENHELREWVGIHTDITQQREVEQESSQLRLEVLHMQKLKAIGQLAAGIAHEINTPIQYVGDNARFLRESFDELSQVLRAMADLTQDLKQGPVAPERVAEVDALIQRVDLEYLLAEIPTALHESLGGLERVAGIVAAMKTFSHPGTTECVPTDINRAIETTATVARNEWKYVADIRMELDPDLPLTPCYPAELNQVILNLIVNAAHSIAEAAKKETDKGTITITTARVQGELEIRVGDTGMGIPDEIHERIFEPFFTTKAVGKGSGQGLSIAHAVVVERHAGRLWFETTPGEGTTFIIRLPLDNAPTENGVAA